MLGAGAMFGLGRFPRLSAFILFLTLLPTTYVGHAFYTEQDPAKRAAQRIEFTKNLSLLGGLLLAVVDTEGRPGLAWRAQHAGRDVRRTAALTGKQARMAAKTSKYAKVGAALTALAGSRKPVKTATVAKAAPVAKAALAKAARAGSNQPSKPAKSSKPAKVSKPAKPAKSSKPAPPSASQPSATSQPIGRGIRRRSTEPTPADTTRGGRWTSWTTRTSQPGQIVEISRLS